MQSAATLREAREIVEGLRAHSMELVLAQLPGKGRPRPALSSAIAGWLGYMDAAILDWTQHKDIPREKLRDLLVTAFGAALLAATQIDPKIRLRFDR
jgi:hypothetical protein